MVGQVAGNTVGSGWEKTAPVDLEVPDGRLVAFSSVIPHRGGEIGIYIAHREDLYGERGQKSLKIELTLDNGTLSGFNFKQNLALIFAKNGM